MEDSAEKKSKIEQFCNISGAGEDRARFFLESAAWNVEAAMSTFFEESGAAFDTLQEEMPPPVAAPPSLLPHQHPPSAGSSQPQPPSQGHPPNTGSIHRTKEPSRFGTIGSLRSGGSDSSDEEGQAFYAGGSERGGGQQILGPKKKTRDTDGIVSDMFKAARDHGAEVVDQTPATAHRPTAAFQGQAYRLGDSESTPSEVVGSARHVEFQQRQVDMVLKMWKNGFSVDDGPLRDFTAPENEEFLNDIRNGDVPHELIQQARGREVNLNLEDHRNEEYVKPVAVVRAFTGEGHRLGCPSDPVSVANSAARVMSGTAVPPVAAAVPTPPTTVPSVSVDPSQPVTSVQIRLADGQKLVQKFNQSHRVSDVRQFIITARPQYATVSFVLMSSFPTVELKDESQTLVEAKLLNALVTQRVIK